MGYIGKPFVASGTIVKDIRYLATSEGQAALK